MSPRRAERRPAAELLRSGLIGIAAVTFGVAVVAVAAAAIALVVAINY